MYKHPSRLFTTQKWSNMLKNDKLNPTFMIEKLVFKLILKRLQYLKVLNTSLDMITLLKYFNAGDY